MLKNEWIRCPVCGSKTRDRLREDTVLKNYPLYCPKCKQDTLVNAKELYITVIKEPDAQTRANEIVSNHDHLLCVFNETSSKILTV